MMRSSLLDNRADLETLCHRVTAERLAEGDSAGEIGPHLEGKVTDLLLPVVAGDLLALDLVTEVLALVDWGKVAQGYVYKVEGVNPWKI